MPFKKLLFQCAIIAASSLLSGMTFNHFHDKGLDVIRKPAAKSSYQRMEMQDPKKVKELSVDEAYTMFKTKAAIFIDARQEILYKMSHIKDAQWLYHLDVKDNPRLKDYKKDQVLIVYCGGPKCDQAEHLADELEELGFTGVFLFTGGMDEWRAAGYPIEERKKRE